MTPIRPVSDEHRHEPADYELEPNELAACPFCGGAAERRDDPGVCDVPFGLVVDHKEGCFFLQPYASTDDEFVAAWNRRASLATRPKGDVREALERLTMRRHHHVASTDGDNCYQCQRDIRDPVHYRAGESHETDIQRALTALTQAPRSCCAEVSATDTEAMRLLAECRQWFVDNGCGRDLPDRIDALAKGGAS